MANNWRERRAAELRAQWKEDPNSVFGLYLHLMGLDVFSELSPGLTLGQVIDTILDKEVEQRRAVKSNG